LSLSHFEGAVPSQRKGLEGSVWGDSQEANLQKTGLPLKNFGAVLPRSRKRGKDFQRVSITRFFTKEKRPKRLSKIRGETKKAPRKTSLKTSISLKQ